MHRSCAATTPGPATGSENLRSILDELFLLSRGEFDHPVLVVRIGEGREDPALQTEIGVVHVRRLDGTGDAQGERAEFGGCHNDGFYRRKRRERSRERTQRTNHEWTQRGKPQPGFLTRMTHTTRIWNRRKQRKPRRTAKYAQAAEDSEK